MGNQVQLETDIDRLIDDFSSISHLLEVPRLARIYAYVLREGPATIEDVVDGLDLSNWSTQVRMDELVAEGILERSSTEPLDRYTADPLSLFLESEGVPPLVSPTLIAVVGRMDEDGDVESFVRNNGIGNLALVLHYAARYATGEISEQEAVRSLRRASIENRAVFEAVCDTAREYRSADPYFDYL